MVHIKITSKKNMKKIPDQEKIWDSIAIPWETYVVKKIPIVEEFLDKVGSEHKGSEKCKIIDLGCGNGRNMISKKNIKYYGVDFSSCQLKNAEIYTQNNKINAEFFKLKADKLNKKIFKDNVFDYGLFIATLHCMETKKQRLNSLKDFYRFLKPKAKALISVWNSEDKRFDKVRKDKNICMSWKKNNIPYMRYYYLYDKQELINLLESIGFKILYFYKPREHDRFSKKNWIIKVKKPS